MENRTFRRLGCSVEQQIDVRVISATNESIENLVEKGIFRLDLWQRLCEADIFLHPLRDRKEDIGPLVSHFVKTMRGGPYTIDPIALGVLCEMNWSQGNIRELRNCLRAMTEKATNKYLTVNSIPERVLKHNLNIYTSSFETAEYDDCPDSAFEIAWKGNSLPKFEHLSEILLLELIRRGFDLNGKTSLRKLSKEIGISRTTLSSRVKNLHKAGYIEMSELNKMVGMTGS